MPSEISMYGAGHDREPTVEELKRELGEARAQQTAVAAILAAISNSPTDPHRVFAEIAASAARLCDAYDSVILQADRGVLRLIAHYGPITTPDQVGSATIPLIRGLIMGRTFLDGQTIQVADTQAEDDEYPESSDFARRLGYRTTLSVPLIRAGETIGVISLRRAEVRQFSD